MSDDVGFALFVGGVIGFLSGLVVMFSAFGDDYEEGQIDALTGKIQYELVEQENKEMVWKKIIR